MLTSELRELTSAEDQGLISELSSDIEKLSLGSQKAYRPDLPGHNYEHIYGEVLPEGIRLLSLVPEVDTDENRHLVIGAILLHDAYTHVPLDSAERFTTKEERTAVLVEPLLRDYFGQASTAETQDMIKGTSYTVTGLTLLQKIVRRADISNVGKDPLIGGRSSLSFLARTVDFYCEERLLEEEYPEQPPAKLAWASYLDKQVMVLGNLIEEDLTLGSEQYTQQQDGRSLGPFNLRVERNIRRLHEKPRLRNPDLFVSRYRHLLCPLVWDWNMAEAYLKDQAAS